MKRVGLTAEGGEVPRTVALNHPRPTTILDEAKKPVGEIIEVTGRLLFANSTTRSNTIKIVEESGQQHRFIVPEGMMADIVKPLWEDRVRVIGVRKGGRNTELQDIEPIREAPNPPRAGPD